MILTLIAGLFTRAILADRPMGHHTWAVILEGGGQGEPSAPYIAAAGEGGGAKISFNPPYLFEIFAHILVFQ